MAKTVSHSDMDFIDDNVFHIEQSEAYNRLSKNGIKSVEFVRAKDDCLLFVEAKRTLPNPNNPADGNLEKFETQISEICEKFSHSLNIYSSIGIGASSESFPTDFAPSRKVSVRFVLVIKNHKPEWCRHIKQKIEATLPPYLSAIWKPKILVINHTIATKYNLAVINPPPGNPLK